MTVINDICVDDNNVKIWWSSNIMDNHEDDVDNDENNNDNNDIHIDDGNVWCSGPRASPLVKHHGHVAPSPAHRQLSDKGPSLAMQISLFLLTEWLFWLMI